jgi:hypothetical protein
MVDIGYFFNTLKNSDISLLGYTFKHERIKDEIISKIPHSVISGIDSSFSFKSWIRNEKINHLLEGTKLPKWVLLDVNDIKAINNSDLSRSRQIKHVIETIRQDMYKDDMPPAYKLLILSPIFTTPVKIYNFLGGNSAGYLSDFIVTISEDNLEVIKNRYDIQRKISLDNLKNYQYICDYENC